MYAKRYIDYENYVFIDTTSLSFLIHRLWIYYFVYRGECRQTFTHSSLWRAERNITVVCFLGDLDLQIRYSLFMVSGMPGLKNFPRTALQRCSETFHAQSQKRGCTLRLEGNKCTFSIELDLSWAGSDSGFSKRVVGMVGFNLCIRTEFKVVTAHVLWQYHKVEITMKCFSSFRL